MLEKLVMYMEGEKKKLETFPVSASIGMSRPRRGVGAQVGAGLEQLHSSRSSEKNFGTGNRRFGAHATGLGSVSSLFSGAS